MSHLVYACRFEISSVQGLRKVASYYTDWIADRYHKDHHSLKFAFDFQNETVPKALPDDHLLKSTSYEVDTAKVYKLFWSIPDGEDSGLRWLNDIRLGQFGKDCVVEHLISVESVEFNIIPARFLVGSPRVVRDILAETATYFGDSKIGAAPHDLQKADLRDFVELLASRSRKLPIVLMAPNARNKPNAVDADDLARKLAGVARVVRISNSDTAWSFAENIGRHLACFNGAVRVYWPGFTPESNPFAHPLFVRQVMEKEKGFRVSRKIQSMIFAVTAFRFVPDQRITDLVRDCENREMWSRLEAVRGANTEAILKSYRRALLQLEKKHRDCEDLEAEVKNLRELKAPRIIVENEPSMELEQETGEVNWSLSSVYEAVETARRSTKLEILKSAYKSAKESPFNRPYDIYLLLTDLDKFAVDWRANRIKVKSRGDWQTKLKNFLNQRGWGKRNRMNLSATAQTKFRSHYEFEYGGGKQLFAPHVTIGAGNTNSCASVHYIFDLTSENIIIGHVGKHLPNARHPKQ